MKNLDQIKLYLIASGVEDKDITHILNSGHVGVDFFYPDFIVSYRYYKECLWESHSGMGNGCFPTEWELIELI